MWCAVLGGTLPRLSWFNPVSTRIVTSTCRNQFESISCPIGLYRLARCIRVAGFAFGVWIKSPGAWNFLCGVTLKLTIKGTFAETRDHVHCLYGVQGIELPHHSAGNRHGISLRLIIASVHQVSRMNDEYCLLWLRVAHYAGGYSLQIDTRDAYHFCWITPLTPCPHIDMKYQTGWEDRKRKPHVIQDLCVSCQASSG